MDKPEDATHKTYSLLFKKSSHNPDSFAEVWIDDEPPSPCWKKSNWVKNKDLDDRRYVELIK